MTAYSNNNKHASSIKSFKSTGGSSKFIIEAEERALYFQDVHVWPIHEKLDYKGWLSNFSKEEDLKIACLILNFFTYYSKEMTEGLLKYAVGQAGRYFSQSLNDWKYEHFRNRCLYTFIPGECPNPTDSGNRYMAKLRDLFDVPENNIVPYYDIVSVLNNSIDPIPVIFVDDFIGSGNQCVKAWKYNTHGPKLKTLETIASTSTHLFAYTTLVANKIGYDHISRECTNLHLFVSHLLGPEYNLLDDKCICWQNDSALYNKGRDFILNTSNKLNIPDNDTVVSAKGFKGQGLALALETTPPDAVPAFFFYCENGWIPLIKRSYINE